MLLLDRNSSFFVWLKFSILNALFNPLSKQEFNKVVELVQQPVILLFIFFTQFLFSISKILNSIAYSKFKSPKAEIAFD